MPQFNCTHRKNTKKIEFYILKNKYNLLNLMNHDIEIKNSLLVINPLNCVDYPLNILKT